MKKTFALGMIVGVLGCGDFEEASQPLVGGIDDEVEAFLESYRLAIETRDTTLLRTFYADDDRFEWIEDGEVRYRSPDDVLAALTALPADAVIHTEYERVEVAQFGDAGASVAMRFQTLMGEGPSAYEFGGMITIVLERGPAGWQIVGGHTSTPRPDWR